MFTTDKIGDTMKAAIKPNDAKEWFGAVPPDLSVMARSYDGKTRRLSAQLLRRRQSRKPAGTTWCRPTSACRTC